MRPTTTIPDALVTRPTTFDVAGHELAVAKVREGRWTVAVDGHPLDASFDTQADAWQAGVREVNRLGAFRGE